MLDIGDRFDSLRKEILFRDDEIDMLTSFVAEGADILAPSLIVHGYKAIGKTTTVTKYLQALEVKHTIVRCDECITRRIMYQRCVRGLARDSGVPVSSYGEELKNRIGDSLYSFITGLQQFYEDTEYSERHVLVLDRFDQCMEPVHEIYAGLIRLREQTNITSLSIIFITTGDDPKEIATLSVPHIYFRPYTEAEATQILQLNQLCHFGVTFLDEHSASYDFWKQYAKVIVDLFFSFVGCDIALLKDFCVKLWDKFIEPVIEETYSITEFVKVLRYNSEYLTSDNVINNSRVRVYGEGNTVVYEEEKSEGKEGVQDLPIHSKYLLLASYLASFNSHKDDMHNFSKIKAVKYKKRASSAASKRGHLSKSDIDSRLLSPSYFDLERWLAILSVVYRTNASSLNTLDYEEILNFHEDPVAREEKKELERSKFTLSRNIDLYSQISTLFSLGLISKSASSDILAARVRWRCNVSWSTIEAIAQELDFPITDYLQGV